MSGEPTISDEQRAEWARQVFNCTPPWTLAGETIVAVNKRLTWLAADHVRLVEENRRLCSVLLAARSCYQGVGDFEAAGEALLAVLPQIDAALTSYDAELPSIEDVAGKFDFEPMLTSPEAGP